jgi:hypothetical protein
MSYSSKFEINIDKKTMIVFRGGVEGDNCYLEWLLPAEKKSIKAEWNKKDIVKFGGRDLPEGLPLDLLINDRTPTTLFYRNKRLYEGGKSMPWSDPDLKVWGDIFSKMGSVSAVLPNVDYDTVMAETRDLESWAGCVASFAGAGGGIGAAIGSAAGPAGAVSGGAYGGAIGGAFGVGYCTAKK